MQGKIAAYYTLGCKLNFAETSHIAHQLSEIGVREAKNGEVADIVVINTCSVTEVAEKKGRQAISRLVKRHPGAFVTAIGCYAQLQPDRLSALPYVDLVVGTEDKGRVAELIVESFKSKRNKCASPLNQVWTRLQDIRTFAPSCSCGNRTRYFIKVQDGCDYYCTYCTIPFARGRSRNGSIADIVAQAESVAKEGAKEIVITGVNIGDFGKSTNERFVDLCRALDKVEGIERFRISSIEPNLLTDELLEFCASSRAFMPHFHIPLQSGSDEVLRLMHRKYDTQLFADKVERVHQLFPDAFIGVDVIVGTRGETAELFDEAERFIEGLDVSQLHVFSYSERPGTKALQIPHVVSPEEKHDRSQRLILISERKLREFYARFEGQTMPVLWEKTKHAGVYNGFTPNYVKVTSKSEMPINNTITDFLLTKDSFVYDE